MARKKLKAKKPKITSTDSIIFANLYKANRPLPVQRLSKRIDQSWKTTNDHVKKLQGLKIVKINKTIRKTNVSLEPLWIDKIRKMKKRK